MNEQVDASSVEVSCTPGIISPVKTSRQSQELEWLGTKSYISKAPMAAFADSAPTPDNPAWTSPAVSPFAVFTAYDVVMHPGSFANLAAV
jgi:hypothetical protein